MSNQAENNFELDKLVRQVRSSAKYRYISPKLVQRLGETELRKGLKIKQAVKSTKNKLHQAAGAFYQGNLDYAAWLEELETAYDLGDTDELKTAARKVMKQHASTRERLPIIDDFFRQIFRVLPEIQSVLDIACGFNPLAIPWMPLKENATYIACDIYNDLVNFLNKFLKVLPIRGTAEICDAIGGFPHLEVDLAIILKTIPCLEQIDKNVGKRLLGGINAKYILVSYPVASLGGKSKGMTKNYEADFKELTADKPWKVDRFEFETELAFLIEK